MYLCLRRQAILTLVASPLKLPENAGVRKKRWRDLRDGIGKFQKRADL